MNGVLFGPALHPGMVTWDEYLFVALGIIALIVIATTGGKPPKKKSDQPGKPPDDTRPPDAAT